MPTQGRRHTRWVRQGRTHLWTQGGTASPAHPPLPPARGRPRPRRGSPHSSPRMFPYLACEVSRERALEMQREPLGGKLELTVPCLALPADSLTEKLFVAREPGGRRAPRHRPSRPLPAPPPRGPRAASAAEPLPSAQEPGLPARLAAYLRCLAGEGWKGRLFCPRRVNRQTPGRRTISVLSVQECGSRGGERAGGGGVGRGPSGQP